MNNFRVGQKVVCVDDTHRVTGKRHPCLENGRVYEVGSFGVTWRGTEGIHLVGVTNRRPEQAFYKERFRPVIERKTDISIFTALLNPANHRVDA